MNPTATTPPTPEATGEQPAAQRPTTGTGTSNRTPEQAVKELLRAWTERDLEAVDALLAPEVEGFTPPSELRGEHVDKALLMKLTAANFKSFTNYRAELRNIVSQGNQAAFEYIESATFTAPLEVGQTQPPTGKSYRNQVVFFLRLNDQGQIAELHQYNDMLLTAHQLGLDLDKVFPLGQERKEREREGINRWW